MAATTSPITSTTVGNDSRSNQLWEDTRESLLEDLMPLLRHPREWLVDVVAAASEAEAETERTEKKPSSSRRALRRTSRRLFRFLEHLAALEDRLREAEEEARVEADGEQKEEQEEEEEEPCSLSGIPSLYLGRRTDDPSDDVSVDGETVWGQVDLQNASLLPRLKKRIRRLGKRAVASSEKEEEGEGMAIRLLDLNGVEDEDESEDGSHNESESEGDNENEIDESDNEEEGEEARRIRQRMEKAMADMDEEEEEEEEEEIENKDETISQRANDNPNKDEEEEDRRHSTLVDPAREDLRDGFFDLHEMEAWADEEEEYVEWPEYEHDGGDGPDRDEDEMDEEEEENAGKKKKDKKKKEKEKVLPHIRQRMGHDSHDDEEEEEEDDDDEEGSFRNALTKKYQPNEIRRKKYRADDEVEALYNLYGKGDFDDEGDFDVEDDDAADAAQMTAADIFGRPDTKLIQKYQSAKDKDGTRKNGKAVKFVHDEHIDRGDDADSWDDHDFGRDGVDWKEGDGRGADEVHHHDDDEESPDSDQDQPQQQQDQTNDQRPKSTHSAQSKKLAEQTLLLEREMMAEKPWKMMGEAKGAERPADSLLDSTPEFEVAFKPPPILTARHTADIEEMIKRRILEEDWDDVVPRELPDIGLRNRKGEAPEVSQEKSKLGLGELYEREYLKKTTGFDRDRHEKQTEEDAAKEEMKALFADLCSRLDALSNYHFAPRPVAEEAEVENREDVPAIAMEEVLPLHVSHGRGVAPEEIYAGGKGRESVLKGESELDQAERNRIRNAKKKSRRKARRQKLADEKLVSKLQPGLGLNNPYEKRKLREELQMARASGKVVVAGEDKAWEDDGAVGKEYNTSAKFFRKMQENVESMVHAGEGDDGVGGEGRGRKRRKGLDGGQGSSVYRL
mmetsp:Transcript_22882/g.47010  ORF Transcript_22882/g.47010 Transcript_22882/m.47010 type:complete len:904 (+) Transcript_22882:114-2825(+)